RCHLAMKGAETSVQQPNPRVSQDLLAKRKTRFSSLTGSEWGLQGDLTCERADHGGYRNGSSCSVTARLPEGFSRQDGMSGDRSHVQQDPQFSDEETHPQFAQLRAWLQE